MHMMTPTPLSTMTDVAAHEWDIDDDVIQLREWGSRRVHLLPEACTDARAVGAAATCAIRLDDPSGCVSRLHAHLVRIQSKWLLRDAASKNGMRLDGARRSEIMLEPGIEIGIGGVTLIAESRRSIVLRHFLARLLGYSGARDEAVDYALRSVRLAAARRAALVLRGECDLVTTAQSIHRHARGVDRPFVVCDPRRQAGKATVRAPANFPTGMTAFAAAAGGTLCVRRQRLPNDFQEVVDATHAPNSQVQLVVCSEIPEASESYGAMPVVIPPLNSRSQDLDQIIREYAYDAIEELAISRSEFLDVDHAWVREHEASSLPEIEKATLRLVALRASRCVSDAAARLGMAPISLSRWIDRRRLPAGMLG